MFSLAIRMGNLGGEARTGKRPPLLPSFVVGFLVLAAINSFGLVPEVVAGWAGDFSRWALLVSIAAVGVKTSIGKMLEVGGGAIALIVAETVFLGAFVLAGLHILT